MKIEEAIQHALEKAEELNEANCTSCSDEHKQLADWLQELVNLRKMKKQVLKRLESEARFYNSASDVDQNIRDGIKKAIDIVNEELTEYSKEEKKRYQVSFVAEEFDATTVELTSEEFEIVNQVLKEANSNVQGYCGSVYIEPEEE